MSMMGFSFTGTKPQGLSVAANTVTQVVPTRLSRGYLSITNISDTSMFFAMDAAAEADKGLCLTAGQRLELSNGCFKGSISVIHSGTGAKKLAIQEGIE